MTYQMQKPLTLQVSTFLTGLHRPGSVWPIFQSENIPLTLYSTFHLGTGQVEGGLDLALYGICFGGWSFTPEGLTPKKVSVLHGTEGLFLQPCLLILTSWLIPKEPKGTRPPATVLSFSFCVPPTAHS